MGLDVGEFLRSFVAFAGELPWQQADERLILQHPAGAVCFRLQPLSARRLGSLSLPVLKVAIDMETLTEDEAAALMARFQRFFQRGGG